jgi:hypothetical protein
VCPFVLLASRMIVHRKNPMLLPPDLRGWSGP